MSKLKAAFVWEFQDANKFLPFWNDGYKAALDIVGRKHRLDWFVGPIENLKVPKNKYDVILYWGSSTDKFHEELIGRPERKLWMYPGGGINMELPKHYNVVFTEDKVYEEQLKTTGTRTIRVTGTNTTLFKPEHRKKLFGAIFPGTFSMWKRQDIFAEAMRQEGLCVGTVQPDGRELVQMADGFGTKLIIGYLPAELLVDLYNMSEVVILPVAHGSQRTLLEALGMNISCVVGNHFKPLVDLAEEIGGCKIVDPTPLEIRRAFLEVRGTIINTRPYVIKHYGEEQFAEKLLRGIEDI